MDKIIDLEEQGTNIFKEIIFCMSKDQKYVFTQDCAKLLNDYFEILGEINKIKKDLNIFDLNY